MKRALVVMALALAVTAGCSGEDLKKQVEKKNQIIAAQEAEIKKIKDDMTAREADLKTQCDQRVQKLTAQHKQQTDALNAKVAECSKKKDQDKASHAQPAKGKAKR